ncbi:Arachidonate 5-lipoxygenase [Datura stramonium]|uniref:Arachidonate 5-lipoxygenase n=1 Tax=Datura stramonium TaxID=4076 RepID=A0ABS8RKR6_DATST|nr:Arachidonate 5-lipoxygenase [Datura stramonium]
MELEVSIWQLAKAYIAVNERVHQLISRLHTHATIEPFVIATNRQLSVLHPIYKLLHPHFRDTMHINALARQTLLNAGGILEQTVFPTKYAMEMTSVAYSDWVFLTKPSLLILSGEAIEDPESVNKVSEVLLNQDYPYAVDGLEIWSAIKSWVQEYCTCYYKTDEMIQKDTELQAWWKELREEGHGDKKDEPCQLGQYPYGGYLPNRLSMSLSRRFMPGVRKS